MPTPAPTVFLTGFGESAINFELGWLVRNIGDGPGIKSDICFSILERFHAEGIVMPFPTAQYPHRGPGTGRSGGCGAAPAPKKPKGR